MYVTVCFTHGSIRIILTVIAIHTVTVYHSGYIQVMMD